MNGPRFSFIQALGHELHVSEWGSRFNPAVIMWHGLARTGRDFDELAAALSDNYFVICPDTIGRGLSSWSSTPEADYTIDFYSNLAVALLDHYNMDMAAWIGTSMGGMIGMSLAAGQHASRLSCLVVNDIGPEVPKSATDRIVQYVSEQPVFETMGDAEAWLRSAYAPFGPANPIFWRRMVRTSVRRTDHGKITLHYDPNIIQQFSPTAGVVSSWTDYASIERPTHVIRGIHSDILTPNTLARMQQEGPKPSVTQIKGCGHAPTLSRPEDIQCVRQILTSLQS